MTQLTAISYAAQLRLIHRMLSAAQNTGTGVYLDTTALLSIAQSIKDARSVKVAALAKSIMRAIVSLPIALRSMEQPC